MLGNVLPPGRLCASCCTPDLTRQIRCRSSSGGSRPCGTVYSDSYRLSTLSISSQGKSKRTAHMRLRLNRFNFVPCLFGVVITMLLGNVHAQKTSVPAAFSFDVYG